MVVPRDAVSREGRARRGRGALAGMSLQMTRIPLQSAAVPRRVGWGSPPLTPPHSKIAGSTATRGHGCPIARDTEPNSPVSGVASVRVNVSRGALSLLMLCFCHTWGEHGANHGAPQLCSNAPGRAASRGEQAAGASKPQQTPRPSGRAACRGGVPCPPLCPTVRISQGNTATPRHGCPVATGRHRITETGRIRDSFPRREPVRGCFIPANAVIRCRGGERSGRRPWLCPAT